MRDLNRLTRVKMLFGRTIYRLLGLTGWLYQPITYSISPDEDQAISSLLFSGQENFSLVHQQCCRRVEKEIIKLPE